MHRTKQQRGTLPEENGDNDNFCVEHYITKYTVNPTITHGIANGVRSATPGKRADLVLWLPAFFGVSPAMLIKSGMIAIAPACDPNATDRILPQRLSVFTNLKTGEGLEAIIGFIVKQGMLTG